MIDVKEKKLTWKTKEGCSRLLAIFVAAVIVFGLFACVFQTNFGTVKIEHITTDARGATLNGELYYPVGTSSQNKLPAIVVTHGGANTYGTTKNIASELARRGFVVFNVSAYGQGMSEQPYYDDSDQGANGLNITKTPAGVYDAIDYVRSLTFVDTTRIGVFGHSMGAYREDFAMIQDCGFFTLNDMMVNVLHDTFGQTFTKEEIYQDADSLAKDRLNADQLAYYNAIRKEKEEKYNTAIKSVCITGIDRSYGNDLHTVSVGGNDVQRSIQANLGFIYAEYDEFQFGFASKDFTKAAWYSPDEDLSMGSWYALDDQKGSSSIIGTLFKNSVANDTVLAGAIANRTARVFYVTPGEDHSMETLSTKMCASLDEYFTQTLGYNCGELSDPNTVPLDSGDTIFAGRVVFNTLTLISTIGMLLALFGILIHSKFFAPCRVPETKVSRSHFCGKQYWIFNAIMFALGFFALYYANKNALRLGWFSDNPAWPLSRPAAITSMFLIIIAVGLAVAITIFALVQRKNKKPAGLAALNIGIKFRNIMKYLLIGIILLVAGYVTNAFLGYFFGQDLRIWQTVFGDMKAENWFLVLQYGVLLLPLYFSLSCGINYMVRTDIPEWKDTLIAILLNTLPIWLLFFINVIVTGSAPFTGTFFSDFLCSYSFLGLIPIIVYINRRLYKFTNSIWASTFVCTLLVAWCLVSSLGTGDLYYSQNWLGNLIGM